MAMNRYGCCIHAVCVQIRVIANIASYVFPVDVARMGELKKAADRSALELAAQLRKDFGDETLNPGSPPQLLNAFRKEGVELENTEAETLSALEDPRAQAILRWRSKVQALFQY